MMWQAAMTAWAGRGFGDVPRLGRRLVEAALLLALAAELTSLGLRLRTRSVVAPAPASVAAPSAPDAALLIGSHLFGAPLASDSPVEADASLALTLTGTVALDDPAGGLALIRAAQGAEHTYPVGADVAGGALLEAVYQTYVILNRGGEKQVLRLPQTKAPLVVQRVARAAPPRPRDTVLESAPVLRRTTGMPNPANVAVTPVSRALHLAPMIFDKHVLGYRVAGERNKPVFSNLPPNAVITAVNGVELTDGATATRAFDSITLGSSAVVTIRTGEGTTNVTVNTADVAETVAAAPKPRIALPRAAPPPAPDAE